MPAIPCKAHAPGGREIALVHQEKNQVAVFAGAAARIAIIAGVKLDIYFICIKQEEQVGKRAVVLTVVALLGWAAFASAEPAAPLLPYNDAGKQMLDAQGKTPSDALKDVPTKAEVGLPVYPGSYMGSGGKSNGVLSSVQLVSKDTPEKVIAWYKKELGKAWKYVPELATKQIGEIGVFVKTDKEKVDSIDSMRMQQIRIAKVEKPEDTGFLAMAFDVTGIKTMINMQIKPLM
jgi:hypothetical protein